MASDPSHNRIKEFWNMGAPPRHAAGKTDYKRNMLSIFSKSLGLLALGLVLGYVFYYFFSSQSAAIIDRFKVLQSFFGISQYDQGMTIARVAVTILLGNFISIICYFGLGYGRLSLPISFISGLFTSVFLFSGMIRNNTDIIPLEVIILIAVEMLYRVLTVSTGEYLSRYRLGSKTIPWVSLIIVFLLYAAAAVYEIRQIF